MKGQTEWIGHAKGAYLYITGSEVVFASISNVHMRLVGASSHPRVEGIEPTGGYSSYFTGGDEKTWFTGISHYSKLRYLNVYPGIDLVYYGSGRNAEYDFIVKPGGNPHRIELAFSDPVQQDHGDLIVGGLRQRKPRVMQDGREIAAGYNLDSRGHVALALARYDRYHELRIDPVLQFSTYLGGPGGDSLSAVKIGPDGNVYVCGQTQSPATPTLNPFQQTNIVPESPLVMKITPTGDRVLQFIILNTNALDFASSLAIDAAGNFLVTGTTRSPNFPLKNPFQASYQATYNSGFVTKIASDGRTLIYSSYLGGSNDQSPNAIGVDGNGNVFVAGVTWSSDFPVLNAYQPTFGGGATDCFISKVSSTGSLLFSTFMGGPGGDTCFALAVDRDGSVVAGGYGAAGIPLINAVQTTLTTRSAAPITPWLMRFSAEGKPLFSTYIAGPVLGEIYGLALDNASNIYVGGFVTEAALSTHNAFQPNYPGEPQALTPVCFFMKLSSDVRSTYYSSYFGGSGPAGIWGLAVDSQGSLYLSGVAESSDFPTKGSLQAFKGGGINNSDFFVAKFTPDGQSLLYSTFVGGTNNENVGRIALDGSGSVYLAGFTASLDYPVTNALQSTYGGGGDGVLTMIWDSTPLPNSPLTPSPAQLIFRYVQNGPPIVPQTLMVSGGAFTASSSAPWLGASLSGNSALVSVNPAGLAPGTYNGSIILTPASGTPASVGVTLSVLSAAPTLTSVDPSLIPVGSTDAVITLHGGGFTSASTIQFNGIPWLTTPVSLVNSSTLQFTMPAAYFMEAGNYPIAVQNPLAPLSNMLSVAVG